MGRGAGGSPDATIATECKNRGTFTHLLHQVLFAPQGDAFLGTNAFIIDIHWVVVAGPTAFRFLTEIFPCEVRTRIGCSHTLVGLDIDWAWFVRALFFCVPSVITPAASIQASRVRVAIFPSKAIASNGTPGRSAFSQAEIGVAGARSSRASGKCVIEKK